jgi:death-on-curing protein
MAQIVWLLEETVIAIDQRQISEHGGSEGLRDEGLLASALAHPQNLLAYA